MASTINVILCAAAALLLWTCVGLAVARAVSPARQLIWPVAPALGWAVHSAAALPIFMLAGFSRLTVAIVFAGSLLASAYALWRQARQPRNGTPRGEQRRSGQRRSEPLPDVPVWAWIGAALLALGPALAILPKFDGDAVYLAAPIFDHAKVAIIDEMIRNGLPPGNPFFGEPGQPTRLVYYYLLHFSAAEFAVLLGFGGWEADAALTWFTAFASLMLMIGLATWLSGRRIVGLLILALSVAGSLRPLLAFIPKIDSVIFPPTGFGGWLWQSAPAPQHLASASCVVLAILLLCELAKRESTILIITLALVVVAGFESSAWVGGVTFAVAAAWVGAVLLANTKPSERQPFLGRCAVAAFCAAALAAPLLYDQAAAMAARGIASPVAFQAYQVMGEFFPPLLRRLIDLPAFWLLLLLIELPAIYVTGLLGMRRLSSTELDPDRKRIATVLIHLTAASLAVSWLMASTVGDNNYLGWRAVLPAVMALTVFAAAGLVHWLAIKQLRLAIVGLVAIALGLPNGLQTLIHNAAGARDAAAKAFAATPEMWAAVRRLAGRGDRIANNPLFLSSMTPWPANISWALLANRRSCYPGLNLAVPFIPQPRQRLNQLDALFTRVFAGEGWPDDLQDMATRYDCRVAVVTELDGAWTRDPFATSPHWRLAETSGRGWRIYVVRPFGRASLPPASP
jgi:hypothetical protein